MRRSKSITKVWSPTHDGSEMLHQHDVLRHDGLTFGVNGALVGKTEKVHQVILCSFLKSRISVEHKPEGRNITVLNSTVPVRLTELEADIADRPGISEKFLERGVGMASFSLADRWTSGIFESHEEQQFRASNDVTSFACACVALMENLIASLSLSHR